MIDRLINKPDFIEAIDRVDMWLKGRHTGRPLVRFTRHNAEYSAFGAGDRIWSSRKERWFDIDFQLDDHEKRIAGKRFHGETFPVFWPNLGPNVLAACYGVPYEFGEVTAWAEPGISEDDSWATGMQVVDGLPRMDWHCEYIRQLDAMTDRALERSAGRYIVGYTDLHPGLDLIAALRGTERTLIDLYDDPETILRLRDHFHKDFLILYDRYDAHLREAGQYSTTWMGIPCKGRMHIPSCDFAAMISSETFHQLALSGLAAEMSEMEFNIFHVDGPGVARHLDLILQLPQLNAIQWVQGQGDDLPILQWIPMIRKIQASGKGVIVDLSTDELEEFMERVEPQGLFLCISSSNEEQELEIVRRLEKW